MQDKIRFQIFAFASVFLLSLAAIGCSPEYPNCDGDGDCHEGEFCVNGQCQMCRDDNDCADGQTCNAGRCETVDGYCQSDSECGEGEECRANRCAAAAQAMSEPEAPQQQACELNAVYFNFDADGLDSSARDAIQANASCLRERGIAGVHVTGHADPRGTEEYNLALGDRRARSVKAYMKSLGVDDGKVSVSSMGEEMANGEDEGSWSRDRRVDFAEQ